MNAADITELEAFLRTTLLQVGLGGLEARITDKQREAESGNPVQRLVGYLQAVEREFELQTVQAFDRIYARMNAVATTEAGGRLTDIVVNLTGPDAEIFGLEAISLRDIAVLDEVVDELRGLIAQLAEASLD